MQDEEYEEILAQSRSGKGIKDYKIDYATIANSLLATYFK